MGALAPSTNTNESSLIRQGVAPVIDATNAAVTWTASQVLNGFVKRSIAGAQTDVSPTAALIFAELLARGVQPTVGLTFDVLVTSVTSTLTVTAGTNVTNIGTNTILAATATVLKYICTAIGATPTFDCIFIRGA